MSRLADLSPDERAAFFDEQAQRRFERYEIDLQLADEAVTQDLVDNVAGPQP